MTRKELHALMTAMCGADPTPMLAARHALELLEAAEEVYAKSEGFTGSIEALEMAARRVASEPHSPQLYQAIEELRKVLDALEPSADVRTGGSHAPTKSTFLR